MTMNKTKAGEVANHTIDELHKVVLSFIPGGALIDGFLGFRSRLKQKRIIDFSEGLKKVLEDCAGRELTASDFETEEFIDIMEFVYGKVLSTKSQRKLEYFRNILFRQIVEPISVETTFTYAHILDEINEIELIFLNEVSSRLKEELTTDTFFDIVFEPIKDNSIGRPIKLNGEQVFIQDYVMHYHLNRLESLGLLAKRKEMFSTYEFRTFEKIQESHEKEFIDITGIGEDFLKFVKSPY